MVNWFLNLNIIYHSLYKFIKINYNCRLLPFASYKIYAVQIVRLEFAHYDFKSRGTISAKDFALSMVASADMNHINKLLDQVDELDNNPSVRDIRITFEVRLFLYSFRS